MHVLVRKAKHAVLFLFFEPLRPHRVVCHLRRFRVRVAVNFYDQFCPDADEVYDILTHRMLFAKVGRVELPIPNTVP